MGGLKVALSVSLESLPRIKKKPLDNSRVCGLAAWTSLRNSRALVNSERGQGGRTALLISSKSGTKKIFMDRSTERKGGWNASEWNRDRLFKKMGCTGGYNLIVQARRKEVKKSLLQKMGRPRDG